MSLQLRDPVWSLCCPCKGTVTPQLLCLDNHRVHPRLPLPAVLGLDGDASAPRPSPNPGLLGCGCAWSPRPVVRGSLPCSPPCERGLWAPPGVWGLGWVGPARLVPGAPQNGTLAVAGRLHWAQGLTPTRSHVSLGPDLRNPAMALLCPHPHGVHRDPWASGEGSRPRPLHGAGQGDGGARGPGNTAVATLQMPSVTASVKGVCTPHSGLPQPGPLSRCPAVRVLCTLWAPGCSRSTSIYTTLVRPREPMSLAKPSRVSRLPCLRDMGPQAPLKAGFWQGKVAHRTSLGQLIPSPGPHAVPLAWCRVAVPRGVITGLWGTCCAGSVWGRAALAAEGVAVGCGPSGTGFCRRPHTCPSLGLQGPSFPE